ncbi:hypothetical protein F5Y15DRAFT_142594 [Xylariaceae sp. FL0016]|nr:hypothetical protein F5Y15DRAFT_142594 [Xylariaceae sp. FL0016]
MDTTTAAFTLQAEPGTDIWRKPPHTNIWNAPISRTSSGFLKKFQSARVTFWADWTQRYDQAGLLLVPKRVSASSAETGPSSPPEKWIKTGIEYYRSRPQLSTVCCDRFADWSIGQLAAPVVDPGRGVTLEARREGDEHGKSVWVYRVLLDETGEVKERVPLREICWIFADEDEGGGEEWVLDVSPLVARPEKGASDSLRATFTEFKVEWLP